MNFTKNKIKFSKMKGQHPLADKSPPVPEQYIHYIKAMAMRLKKRVKD